MNDVHGAEPMLGRTTRRTLAKGAAWSVPVVALAAPAAYAGPSACLVTGSLQLAPNANFNGGTWPYVRAICTSQSQWLHPGTISANYATGWLPPYLEICNCQDAPAWYRWRETDTLSEFQIEVDGVHVDQNSSAAGWRASFWLPGFGEQGGCKRFMLTYRTSVSRPDNSQTNVSISFELQRSTTSANGPWTSIYTTTRAGWIQRNSGQGGVNFNSCSGGGSQNRGAEPSPGGGD